MEYLRYKFVHTHTHKLTLTHLPPTHTHKEIIKPKQLSVNYLLEKPSSHSTHNLYPSLTMTCQRMLASMSGTKMLPGSLRSPPQATMPLAKHRHHIRSQNSNGKQPVHLLTKNLRSCKGHNMQIIASTFISLR